MVDINALLHQRFRRACAKLEAHTRLWRWMDIRDMPELRDARFMLIGRVHEARLAWQAVQRAYQAEQRGRKGRASRG